MTPKTIWSLPKLQYASLSEWVEERPVALITSPSIWDTLGSQLDLPIIVQAEPERTDSDFLDYLSENVPSIVEAVYVVGSGHLVTIGKIVAHANELPLVIVPTELDSDQFLEAHVEILSENILTTIYTGAAEQVVIDWDIIANAAPSARAGLVADMLAVVTGLLDWRYAAKQKRTLPEHTFVPWVAGVSANLASETIKAAEAIGKGEVEALKKLLNLASISVQLANQLGHARQQEGTEHYFAYALEKQNVQATHAECLGPGILLTSALHNQDPSALRDAMTKSGLELGKLRPADIQLALTDLPLIANGNDLPYAIAHEVDPYSEQVQKALELAGLSIETGAWAVEDTNANAPAEPDPNATLAPTPAVAPAPAQPNFGAQAAAPQQPTDSSNVLPPQWDASPAVTTDQGAGAASEGGFGEMPPATSQDESSPDWDNILNNNAGGLPPQDG